jgi:hypothetical protein
MFRPRVRGRLGRWLFAFTAASALVLASGAASAGDGDGDLIDDGLESATARTVEVRSTPLAFPTWMRLTSQSVGSPTNDWFRVEFESGEFDVEYVRESEGGLVQSSFRLEVKSIVEWMDANGDSAVQWAEVLNSTELGGSAFGGIPITHNASENADGGIVHTIGIRSNGNEVSLTLTIAQRFYRVAPDRILTPMELKVDAAVVKPLGNPGARVGLGLWIRTDHDLSLEARSWADLNGFSTDESAVNVTAGTGAREAAVFFSWTKQATVSNRTGNVSVEGPSLGFESDGYDMILGYPAGDNPGVAIVDHEAGFGVVSAAYGSVLHPPPGPLNADALLFGASLAGVAALVIGTMVAARRRRSD